MSEIRLNVNDRVRIRLTRRGRQILAVNGRAIWPKEDRDGYSEWQLWELFELFGDKIYLGCETPFETEIILGPSPAVTRVPADRGPGARGLLGFEPAHHVSLSHPH